MADTGKTIGLIKALASVDPSEIQSSVEGWLDDHPEATTTVQDGSITKAKLDQNLQSTVDDVGDLKSASKHTMQLMNNAIDNFYPYSNFDHYGLNTDGSFLTTQKYRVSCTNHITVDQDLLVHVKSGYQWGYIPFVNGSAGSWVGWKWADYTIPAGTEFVVQIRKTTEDTSSVADVGEFTAAVTFDSSLALKKTVNENRTVAEIYPIVGGISFSGNTNADDPLVATLTYLYVRDYAANATAAYRTVNISADSPYSIPKGYALYFDVDNNTVSVKNTASALTSNYITLLWKQGTLIKGELAYYYYDQVISAKPTTAGVYTKRFVSRQGEGFGYPDNSIEAITAALKDGFRRIRISVAVTSDGVPYCTHSYEMQHNSEQNCLSINGVQYTENVNINDTTSTFIESLTYKGYPIPTLEEALAVIEQFDADVTFELKDSYDTTSAKTIIDLATLYGVSATYRCDTTANMDIFTGLNNHLDMSYTFHFSEQNRNTAIGYANVCKSLEFACYMTDTITSTDVLTLIKPDYILALGGTLVTAEQAKNYLKYGDRVEVALRISEMGIFD